MSETLLVTRTFSLADQRTFADVSGDANPMHLDAVAARRTPAGEPVVHGMHALLWALETCCKPEPAIEIDTIKVAFERFVPLNVPVTLWLKEDRLRSLVLRVRTARLVTIALNPSTRGSLALRDMELAWNAPRDIPSSPSTPCAAKAGGMAGVLRLRSVVSGYPTLAGRIGADMIDAVAGLSSLVGMVVPGRHSIFSAADLRLRATALPSGVLGYHVRQVQDVFKRADIEFAAAGLSGTLKAFFRPPPACQAPIADLGRLVGPDEFVGMKALVIGGSRGIGEVAAKLLAAGGAEVVISYATGREDAEDVVRDIRSHGATCRAIQVDAREALAPQIVRSPTFEPSHILYFATNKISSQRDGLFDIETFERLARIHVTAFAELCSYAAELARRGARVTLFYPSTSYLDARPDGMTEYAMAKAAGEVLCADAARNNPRLRVVSARLPPMPTDQTASVSAIETTPIAPHMLPILRSLAQA